MAVAGAVSAVAAVVGVGYSIYSGERAADAQEEAQATNRASQGAALAAQRRQQVRQRRIRQAQILSEAETRGVAGASSETGALGSIATQFASNIAFSTGQTASADAMSKSLSKAAGFKQQQQIGSAISSLGFTGLNLFGGSLSAPTVDPLQAPRHVEQFNITSSQAANAQPSQNIQ